MNNNKIVYEGNAVFSPINFGLYGYDNINFEESKESIEAGFRRELEKFIRATLDLYGMEYLGLEWFSPREYNFSTDSLDLVARVVDKNKIKAFIIDKGARIKELMAANHSRDGFISHTQDSLTEELNDLEIGEDYRPDLLVVKAMLEALKTDFEDFEIEEHLAWEDEEELEAA